MQIHHVGSRIRRFYRVPRLSLGDDSQQCSTPTSAFRVPGYFQYRLEKRGITHWWTSFRSPKMNPHVEFFNRNLADWLLFSNTERPTISFAYVLRYIPSS